MISQNLIIVTNTEERDVADALGISYEANLKTTKVWFSVEMIKRAYINSDDEILLIFDDGEIFCMEQSDELLKVLDEKFK